MRDLETYRHCFRAARSEGTLQARAPGTLACRETGQPRLPTAEPVELGSAGTPSTAKSWRLAVRVASCLNLPRGDRWDDTAGFKGNDSCQHQGPPWAAIYSVQ